PVLNMTPLMDQILRQDEGASAAPVDIRPQTEPLILIVDDSLTMRVALTQTLEHAGYIVLAARDGHEALELIRVHGVPRLVTLDLEMPRMDGLETLYAIRHTLGGEAIPIFMLTSRTGQQHQRTAMTLGATRYFIKPYHDREFLQAVQEATGATLRPAG
ncbi:MAG TPA: response regulator, partial [Chloroflexota bacterium]|nr:response regulator [Chloroflexota bacterium]